MDLPISDALFHDDDLTTVEARLESDQVNFINDYANEKETSFDQALRYLINIACQRLTTGEGESAASGSNEESVYGRFRKLADRLNRLEAKSRSIEKKGPAELLETILKQSEAAAAEGDPADASNQDAIADSDDSGPPSMFDIADEL